MTKPAESSTNVPTPKPSGKSTKRILVISILVLIAVSIFYRIAAPQYTNWPDREYLDRWREDVDKGPFIRNQQWVNANLYRVDSYRQRRDGNYDVSLIQLEKSEGESFDKLIQTFWDTPYTTYNTDKLSTGVNCQGMVCYIASWCKETGHDYKVEYTSKHVTITVTYGGEFFEFSFSQDNPYIRRVDSEGKEVS